MHIKDVRGALRHVMLLESRQRQNTSCSGNVRDGAGMQATVMETNSPRYLLPRHRHVLQELVDGMRYKFQGTKVHSFVLPKLLGGHITVILQSNVEGVLNAHSVQQVSFIPWSTK